MMLDNGLTGLWHRFRKRFAGGIAARTRCVIPERDLIAVQSKNSNERSFKDRFEMNDWPALTGALQGLMRKGGWGAEYAAAHRKRFLATAHALAALSGLPRRRALELGESWVMAPFLAFDLGFFEVDVTGYKEATTPHVQQLFIESPQNKIKQGRRIFINFEESTFPIEDGFYNLVLCCEVIEHMERDPMFLICELNRILTNNGVLLISTPNSISAENVFKILNGFAPHFYMKYISDRSMYRHNIEYAPHQISAMLVAGGFCVERMWTENTFSPGRPSVVAALKNAGYPADLRGDNLFVIARKVQSIINRYPEEIYEIVD